MPYCHSHMDTKYMYVKPVKLSIDFIRRTGKPKRAHIQEFERFSIPPNMVQYPSDRIESSKRPSVRPDNRPPKEKNRFQQTHRLFFYLF